MHFESEREGGVEERDEGEGGRECIQLLFLVLAQKSNSHQLSLAKRSLWIRIFEIFDSFPHKKFFKNNKKEEITNDLVLKSKSLTFDVGFSEVK